MPSAPRYPGSRASARAMRSSASSQRHAREGALALGALSDRRVEQAILAVDALGEPPHLGADVIRV